jgi:hypothetical protein
MFAEITDEIEDLARERIGQGSHLLVNEFGDSHSILLVNAGARESLAYDGALIWRSVLVGEASLVGTKGPSSEKHYFMDPAHRRRRRAHANKIIYQLTTR